METTTKLEELRAVHDQKMAARVSLEKERDEALVRAADADALTFEVQGKARYEAIAKRNAEHDLVGVLEKQIALAEAARIEAANAASAEGGRLAALDAAAKVKECQEKTDHATANLEAAAQTVKDAIVAHVAALDAARPVNDEAAGYGLPVTTPTSTRALLEEIGAKLGLWIGPIDEHAPARRVVVVS
jgi:hypothetical protein